MNTAPIFIANQRANDIQFAAAGAKVQCLWQAGPNGSRLQASYATQDDTTTSVMQFYRGVVLTDNGRPMPIAPFPGMAGWSAQLNSQMPTPVLALTNTTITRTNGSFIADGWNVGMLCGVIGCADNIQNQVIPSHVTTVAAGTLTFTGAVFTAAATPSPMTQLVRCTPMWNVSMVNGAGVTSAVAQINMLSTAVGTSLLAAPDGFITLGPNELLLVYCTTLPAANKCITVSAHGGDY